MSQEPQARSGAAVSPPNRGPGDRETATLVDDPVVPDERPADEPGFPGRIAALIKLVVASAVAGVLVAGLVLPAIGPAGVAAHSFATTFADLPAELTVPPLAQRTQVLANDGSVIANFYSQNRVVVELDRIPEHMQDAIVAIEDSRFWDNPGIDAQGTLRAALANAGAGEVEQGGSTITQQYVKNVLLLNADSEEERRAATEKSIARKLREARYALHLTETRPKEEILEGYLNLVYFGSGAYGVATAAHRFFNKDIEDLTLAESALLAGMVNSPTRYDPRFNPENAVARRNLVLQRMRELGMINDHQLRNASSRELEIDLQPFRNGCEPSWASYYCDWVTDLLIQHPALGETEAERRSNLLGGGLTIQTTLDPHVQRAAQQGVNDVRASGPGVNPVAAMAVVEPGSGRVLAMVANRKYGRDDGESTVNFVTGGKTGFQPGSTFKVFTLAAALMNGIRPDDVFDAPSPYESDILENRDDNGRVIPWTVYNAGDSSAGTLTVTEGTWRSVNTLYVQLLEEIGLRKPVRLAEAMGARAFGGEPIPELPSVVLGAIEVSPLDLANAYATFSARGKACKLMGIQRITDASGEVLVEGAKECQQVMPQNAADNVTAIIRDGIDGPDPYRTGGRASIGRPAAGKTGSTNDAGAAWFCGYTVQLAGCVWMGDPRGPKYALENVTAPKPQATFSTVYGGTLPAMAWQIAMARAHQGLPAIDFKPPKPMVSWPEHARNASGDRTPPPPPEPVRVEPADDRPEPKPDPDPEPKPKPKPKPEPEPEPEPEPQPEPDGGDGGGGGGGGSGGGGGGDQPGERRGQQD